MRPAAGEGSGFCSASDSGQGRQGGAGSDNDAAAESRRAPANLPKTDKTPARAGPGRRIRLDLSALRARKKISECGQAVALAIRLPLVPYFARQRKRRTAPVS